MYICMWGCVDLVRQRGRDDIRTEHVCMYMRLCKSCHFILYFGAIKSPLHCDIMLSVLSPCSARICLFKQSDSRCDWLSISLKMMHHHRFFHIFLLVCFAKHHTLLPPFVRKICLCSALMVSCHVQQWHVSATKIGFLVRNCQNTWARNWDYCWNHSGMGPKSGHHWNWDIASIHSGILLIKLEKNWKKLLIPEI